MPHTSKNNSLHITGDMAEHNPPMESYNLLHINHRLPTPNAEQRFIEKWDTETIKVIHWTHDDSLSD